MKEESAGAVAAVVKGEVSPLGAQPNVEEPQPADQPAAAQRPKVNRKTPHQTSVLTEVFDGALVFAHS